MNCEHCGSRLAPGSSVCAVCGTRVGAMPTENPVRENVALGTLGALIGALLGGASIILFSRLGYVAALSGVLIAFATLKGYELLGKGMSKTGLVICFVLMLVTPFLANALDLVMQFHEEWKDYGMTMMDTASWLGEMLIGNREMLMLYLKDLGMIYLFMVIGAFSIVRNALRSV